MEITPYRNVCVHMYLHASILLSDHKNPQLQAQQSDVFVNAPPPFSLGWLLHSDNTYIRTNKTQGGEASQNCSAPYKADIVLLFLFLLLKYRTVYPQVGEQVQAALAGAEHGRGEGKPLLRSQGLPLGARQRRQVLVNIPIHRIDVYPAIHIMYRCKIVYVNKDYISIWQKRLNNCTNSRGSIRRFLSLESFTNFEEHSTR